MKKIKWDNPPSSFTLNKNDVHIHHVGVTSVKICISLFEKILTSEEKLKISKFIFEKDHIVHTVSSAMLKNILSRYLQLKPEDVIIAIDEYGKPYVNTAPGAPEITFNLSHSDDTIVYAISENRRVGIDVEAVREIDSIDDLVKQNFSPEEINTILPLAGNEKVNAFYSCWTKKEAYVKALGQGLSYPLDKFTVSVFPCEESSLLHDENNDVSLWTLKEIQAAPGYAAAAAVEGGDITFRYCRWNF